MNGNSFVAVFNRNLIGYFTRPIGITFICIFAALHLGVALWRGASSGANVEVAGLGLAVTIFALMLSVMMSVWATDRRQGADKVLATHSLGNTEVLLRAARLMLGKYLAAVVVFSLLLAASLAFCAALLGWPSVGTYFNYWVAGLVVLAGGVCTSLVLRAVFGRNFIGYFSSPTGYLFICIFVLLSSFAAFWPYEFFNANLANLDQLNQWFPFIMLIFIPAITMSVWAEERRQGTDELLLTVPGRDFDIVLGKYLAAVGIYSTSLVFSLVCNFAVLNILGNPDVGLFLSTYLGYWLIGLVMLAVGMVASFLTANLTIGYILAAAFNVPLVLAVWSDAIFPAELALAVKQWSIGEQLGDFGGGIISLSGVAYFAMIVAVMLYVSMVLIGRRHWGAGHWKIHKFFAYQLVALAWFACFLIAWGIASLFCTGSFSQLFREFFMGCYQVALLDATGRDAIAVLAGVATLFMVPAVTYACGYSWFPNRLPWMLAHYTVRTLVLAVVAVSVIIFTHCHDWRLDVTSEQLSSLSPYTIELLDELKITRPVQIEAFVSPEVPESYIQTRSNLLRMLRELAARGGGQLTLRVYETERYSTEADRAEKAFDITPRRVVTYARGAYSQEYIFMGVAFSCGLERVVLPFVNRGIPVQYELVRSICTVTQQKRKKIGVLRTDAGLFGQFNMRNMSRPSNWPIIDELEKQYEVVEVNPASPITEKYDALLAVQPSSLGPAEMGNFIAAIEAGQPTAIFEDPLPFWAAEAPATSAPKRPPGGMQGMMMGARALPKGDISKLWRLLGIDFSGDDGKMNAKADQIVWQLYNPYPKLDQLPIEFVFVGAGSGAKEPFDQSEAISSQLQQVLFPYPGFLVRSPASEMKFAPLVRTGDRTGTVPLAQVMTTSLFGQMLNPNPRRVPTFVQYVLAAHIRGVAGAKRSDAPVSLPGASLRSAASHPSDEAKKKEAPEINVVVVADIDMLHRAFFRLREEGEVPGAGISLNLDNVTFVLNILDALAGDPRFLELRKRRPKHRTLTRIDQRTEQARKEAQKTSNSLREAMAKAREKEEKVLNDKIADLRKTMREKQLDQDEIDRRVGLALRDLQRRLKARMDELEQENEDKINKIETQQAYEIRRLQDWYKAWAVLLPPIPPLVLAVIVFFTRRARQREGVSRTRLR